MTSERTNPFRMAQRQLDEAAALLGLEPALHALLREPDSRADGQFPGQNG